jgi:dTDP-4-amino-4,6-dideoxygalactose transaminase
MINVTKTFLPPLAEYSEYLKGIWERGHVTNHGPLVAELEQKLKELFGVKHFFFVNNGTIALQIAIKALDLSGKVITTPFSYVATTSSLVWENCRPVFADIKDDTLCIDPGLIRKAITPDTTGIMATHVYGIPCDVKAIEQIALEYNLKVIYDAAHAFNIRYHNRHLVSFGDISVLSFHATKIFHTGEGGGIITNNDELAHRISYLRNFGHNGPEAFQGVGINGKSSEIHAAMGLCVLPYIEKITDRRKELYMHYNERLKDCMGIKRPFMPPGMEYNYAYYPVIFESEKKLLQIREALNKENIFPRRYFYPSLSKLDYVDKYDTPVSESISARILCLPLYYELKENEVNTITDIIKKTLLDGTQ